jgi:hypothetical protein
VHDVGTVQDPTDIGDVVRLTGFQRPSPERTTPQQIGYVVLPFLTVSDPAVPRDRQATDNPYYVLSRHGYWSLGYYDEDDGVSQRTSADKVQVGLTTGNASAVQSTVGISVALDGSMGLSGLTRSLSAQISTGLRATTFVGAAASSTNYIPVSHTYPAGSRVAEAIWFKEDKYTLTRLDGTVVIEWVMRDPDTRITDAYVTLPQRARLTAKHSGQRIDIAGAGTDNGARAVQWYASGDDNQKFSLEPTGDGAGVLQWDVGTGENQQFRAEPAGEGHYRFVARHSGKMLAVEGASTDAGTRLLQWASGSSDNEIWHIEAIADADW